MRKIEGITQQYSWGSKELIPKLCGNPNPSAHPIAELWFGAHPSNPSRVDGTPLTDIIADNPEGTLGPRVHAKFGSKLPFLMKILGISAPLSLQAHPSKEQALRGFKRENQQEIPLSSTKRNYRDPSHKPELVVALSQFQALAGFRPIGQTIALFQSLGCPKLVPYLEILDEKRSTESLKELFIKWVRLPEADRSRLISGIIDSTAEHPPQEEWIDNALSTAKMLQNEYPNDIGVLGSLLLNHISLSPGEALYLESGHLHAYLSGLAIEVMANSDNVLRGGLTDKHVDLDELIQILDFRTIEDPTTQCVENVFITPIEEFSLLRQEMDPGQSIIFDHDGPAIAVCTSGSVSIGGMKFGPGEAVWISASDRRCTIASETDSELFIASA